MARRHYSDADRANGLAMLDANAGNVSRTSRAIGIPRATLQAWIADRDRAAPPDLRHEQTATLADLFEREAHAALERAGMVRDDARYQQLMTGAAIATDKAQLLRGGATARVAHEVVIDVSDDGRGD